MKRLVDLSVAGNEASDLLRVESAEVLAALGARAAYWTVLDEGPVEECLAVLSLGADGWHARHLPASAGTHTGRTEDGEALARHDGWVYVIGSHFGSKAGPLRPKRAFVARFAESLTPQVQVVRHRFTLHRLVNEALRRLADEGHPAAPEPPAARVHASFIEETLRRGQAKAKQWVTDLRPGDHPINVEGAAFTPSGSLLLGLRWPVSTAGEPLLVEIAGIPGLFAEPPLPLSVVGVYAVTGAGPGPLGVRALAPRPGVPGEFDVIVGSIDALGKNSVIIEEHPQARDATCAHLRFRVPADGSVAIKPVVVADLAPLHHVEGVAELDGSPLYVTDEAHRVSLWVHQTSASAR
ncbi:hypothetical protein HDA40_007314 [Hamadaea flava]|uniref:DUF4185 domain-containing protein n=1 Tax=Hamadaea flava TaxID=1742688 RepID=A0ABV8LWY7_9ACTN|nr:hypothetical protein [Hamadaea flava]